MSVLIGGYSLGKEDVDLESQVHVWEPMIWLAGVKGDWKQ